MSKIDFAILFLLVNAFCIGCQKDLPEPIVPVDEFQMEPGFQITCVAAEPLIDTPVEIEFDADGRMWAVEMPGYMPNANGTGEDAPVGKIVILEDRDGDGIMDTRKVFLENLVMPRALALAYGGLLYCEPPKLWFVEIQNDRPGKSTLVDSAYAPGFNPEYQANGLLYNLDNWIYSAGSDKRYRLKNGHWQVEKTYYRGQWGITQDENGHLLYNSNSIQLLGDDYLPGTMEGNPAAPPLHSLRQVLTGDQRVFPLRPTLVNRGYQPGVLDAEGRLTSFTAACGPSVYLGGQFPPAYQGNVFVCAPEAHLIKRNLLFTDPTKKLAAQQAYNDREFLASTDGTFRPVNLCTGPDGCIYVVDMRRGIVQHKAYLSLYLKNEAERQGLDTVIGKGRIYRICHEHEKGHNRISSKLKNMDLVHLISSENHVIRMKCQQMLIERNAMETVPVLKKMIKTEAGNAKSFHALWTLEGLQALDDDILAFCLNAPNERLVEQALKLLPAYLPANRQAMYNMLFNLANRKNKRIDLNLMAVLGRMEFLEEDDRWLLLGSTLMRYPNDTLANEAALSGLSGREESFRRFLQTVFAQQLQAGHSIFDLLEQAIRHREQPPKPQPVLFDHNDRRTTGLHLYVRYCAACHRPGGEGTPKIAPPLIGSKAVNGPRDSLSSIIWNGKTGPVQVNGEWVHFSEPMQAFKENPEWDPAMLEAVVAYVKNAFGEPD